jgi:FAD-dependent oxidoreductase domain-containing protein 1
MAEVLDVFIIGAGVLGSSVALHLAKAGVSGIRVVDLDLEGTLSSSELNAGGVRATFNHPINIQMSKVSIEYFAQHAADMGYRDVGYLWLQKPETMPRALKSAEVQRSLGWKVDELDVAGVRKQVPFIDKTDDLAGAVFAPRDGLVNPNLVKIHYRNEAKKLGVKFEDRVFVQSAEEVSAGEMKVKALKLAQDIGQEEKVALYQGKLSEASAKVLGNVEYTASTIINCAGPWAAEIAKILGYESPSFAVRRQISIFDCRDVDLSHSGMIVDTSGVYFHPEAMNGLAGFANHDEQRGVNYVYDGEAFFMEYIWPPLYERSTKFERLKHMTGWAGLYDVSPDESSIIGKATRGKREKFHSVYEAHSFSGHGVMHCHAAGIALAELITKGKFETIDATPLSAKRFLSGRLVRESAVI